MKKLVLAGLVATQLMWGQATPLRMLCSNGVRGAILDLKADWEKAAGRPINIEYEIGRAHV